MADPDVLKHSGFVSEDALAEHARMLRDADPMYRLLGRWLLPDTEPPATAATTSGYYFTCLLCGGQRMIMGADVACEICGGVDDNG